MFERGIENLDFYVLKLATVKSVRIEGETCTVTLTGGMGIHLKGYYVLCFLFGLVPKVFPRSTRLLRRIRISHRQTNIYRLGHSFNDTACEIGEVDIVSGTSLEEYEIGEYF